MNPTKTVTTNSWASPDSHGYVSGEPRLKVVLKSLTHDNVHWDDSFSRSAYIRKTPYQLRKRHPTASSFLTQCSAQVVQVKESQYPSHPLNIPVIDPFKDKCPSQDLYREVMSIPKYLGQ